MRALWYIYTQRRIVSPMFFQKKVHLSEVIKWGVFAGLFEGLYIGLAAILLSQQYRLETLIGWEVTIVFLFMLVLSVSAIVTTVIVFAHPIYSLLRKQYRDAVATLLVTLLTLVAVYGFVAFTYRSLFS